MEFENQNSQAHSTPCFQNNFLFTPDQSQHFYTVPNNTMNPFTNQFQQFSQQQYWCQGANLLAQQTQPNPNPIFQQAAPLQMNTQQFFQQPQEQEEDQDQDYSPEDEEPSSSESEEQEENLQEEEQFDDPDFDLQAYLRVRDQL